MWIGRAPVCKGGIHSDVAESKVDLNEINQIIRNNYYLPYFPKQENTIEQLLISTKKGVNWYRRYFKEDLTQEQIENMLKKFGANAQPFIRQPAGPPHTPENDRRT